MVLKIWLLSILGICINFNPSSSLPERCNLKVEIDYTGPPGIDPTVRCSSSDCGEAGKTFYYLDESLEQEYNSVVQISFDDEANVICNIIPITPDILKREDLTNSTFGDETRKMKAKTESEVASPNPDYVSNSSPPEFTEFDGFESEDVSDGDNYQSSGLQNTSNHAENTEIQYQYNTFENSDISDSEDQSQSSELKSTLPALESIENSELEYQSNTSFKDDESMELSIDNSNDTESSEEANSISSTSEEVNSISSTSEVANEIDTEISKTENVTLTEELQNENQETDKNFETTQQGDTLYSQEDIKETTNQTTFLECTEGWTLNPESETCYLVTQNAMNWYDANIVCVQLGGKLSIFHSQDEVNFVKENVEIPESSWIGLEYTLSDNLTSKTWRWIDRSVADFTDWATGEPSSVSSLWDSFWAYPNCVEMKKSDGFAWNDERCTNFKRGLCSKEAELAPRSCPDGWLLQNNKCYHFCEEELSEEFAVLLCSSHAVRVKLFVPEDDAEMDFVSDKLKEKNVSTIWLGMKDTQENGDFRTPEGEVQTFFRWNINEPSKSFWWFNVKECVQMSSESRMERAKCNKKLPFVCVLDLRRNK